MNNIESIKETIRNLRARAADEGSSESEALAAIAKADKLMQKHALTIDELETEASNNGIVTVYWTKDTKKRPAVTFVASSIALLTETKGWEQTSAAGLKSLAFMGFEADTEYALYLCDLIHNAMEAGWDEYKETADYASVPRNKRGRLRDDFMRGVAVRIRAKITALVAERRTQAPDIKTTSGTDIVVAKRTLIAEAFDEQGMELRKKRKPRKVRVDASAYFAGQATGEKTNIVTGIGRAA